MLAFAILLHVDITPIFLFLFVAQTPDEVLLLNAVAKRVRFRSILPVLIELECAANGLFLARVDVPVEFELLEQKNSLRPAVAQMPELELDEIAENALLRTIPVVPEELHSDRQCTDLLIEDVHVPELFPALWANSARVLVSPDCPVELELLTYEFVDPEVNEQVVVELALDKAARALSLIRLATPVL